MNRNTAELRNLPARCRCGHFMKSHHQTMNYFDAEVGHKYQTFNGCKSCDCPEFRWKVGIIQ